MGFGLGESGLGSLKSFFHNKSAHTDAGGGGGLLDSELFFVANPEGDLFTQALLGSPGS